MTGRRVAAWIGLLAAAQLADLLTTQVDMAHGGMEANMVAANLLAVGGLAMLWVVKLLLVVAMALAAIVVTRYHQASRDLRYELARTLVWRGLQVCVLVLVLTAAHNVAVLGQLQA